MSQPSPVLSALGYLLLCLGGLWALLAGGCTLYFLVSSMSESSVVLVPISLVVGFVGAAPGIAICWAGLAILRRQVRLKKAKLAQGGSEGA
jgi:hypothetical protein